MQTHSEGERTHTFVDVAEYVVLRLDARLDFPEQIHTPNVATVTADITMPEWRSMCHKNIHICGYLPVHGIRSQSIGRKAQ